MNKKLGIVFFLLGFLFFSFFGSICLLSKMKTQDLAQIISNIAEEEDETEKDSKSESDDFIELLDAIHFNYIPVAHNFFVNSSDPIPLANPNTLIQPPETTLV